MNISGSVLDTGNKAAGANAQEVGTSGSEVQGYPQVDCESATTLGYMRSCIKTETSKQNYVENKGLLPVLTGPPMGDLKMC